MTLINQTLNNRYRVLAQLGKGAMGEVFRAFDRQAKQEVALKIIARDLALDREMLERFRREGEALRQLRNANIVAFVDMFVHQDQQVIVMEYAPGGSLYTLIRQGPLPAARACEIALDMCDALIHAHRLNIIHRDIKPENVLLTQNGTPKLTDFGVARLLAAGTRLTGTGTQVGTPYYMSPEAWEGKALDAQADVWSLGVVLFEMLSGQVPFAGDTAAAVMTKVLMTPPPNLRALKPDMPPELVKVAERALMRDKAQRYLTVRQMSAELELCAHQALHHAGAASTGAAQEPAQATAPVAALRRDTPSPIASDATATSIAPSKPKAWLKRGAALGIVIVGLLVIAGGLVAAGGIGMWTFNNAQAHRQATQTAAAAIAALPSATPRPSDTPVSPTPVPPTPAPRPSDTQVPPTPVPPTSTLRPTDTSVPPTRTLAPTSASTGGTIEGFVSWNGAGFSGVKVKVCTQWLFSCQTKEYSATSDADGHYRITDLPPGDYFFITKTPDQMDETRWPYSTPSPWVIKVTAGSTAQQDVSVFKHDLKLSSPSFGATVSGGTPMLSWKVYPGATGYQVAAGRTAGSGNYVSHEGTTAPQLAVTTPIGQGEKVYWRVTAYNDQGMLAISPDYWFVVGP